MPFYYDVKIPAAGGIENGQSLVFVKWLTTEKSYVKPGAALAILESGHARYLLRNAGEGFFTPWSVREGEELTAGQAIGRITADGDLIPYGRAYFTLEAVASEKS